MRRLLIGTPSIDGRVDVHFTKSLVQTARLCQDMGIYQREVFLSYDSIIQNARNDLIRLAIEHDFDDLIFIDGDQDWQPEWVIKLMKYPVDVVGGAVRKKTDDAELYNVKHPGTNIPVDPKTGLLMPEGLGTGFLRLSRKAMRALWDEAEPYQIVGGPSSRWVFDIRPVNGFLVGEDTMLCQKLRRLGMPVHLDASMTCGHLGTKKFSGDFAAWLARLQGAQDRAQKELPDGLWVLPSRQRVSTLERFFKSAIKNGTSTKGVVLVQRDELAASASEYDGLKAVMPAGWSIVGTESEGLGNKFREAEPLYMDKKWVGVLVDDVVIETPGWDRHLVSESMKTGKLMCCDEGSQAANGRICGALVWPTGLVRAIGGHIWPEGFNHLYADDVWEEINAQTGFARRVPQVMTRHISPFVTGDEDDTHKASYSKHNWEHDAAAFEKWKKESMVNVVADVKKYLSSIAVPT